MKRRALYFLLCLCFCFSSLSLSSSAVGDDSYYIPTYEEYIEMGYLDGGGGLLYYPEEYESPFFFANFLSEPIYPNFNINSLPWLDMPKYIQDIVYSDISHLKNLTAQAPSDFRVPFVMVVNYGSYCNVWVGYNLALGVVEENGYIRIFGTGSAPSYDYALSNKVCYMASYNISASSVTLRSDWEQRPGSDFWSGTNLVYYSGNFSNTQADFYLYGANAIHLSLNPDTGKIDLYTSLTIQANTTNYSEKRVAFSQNVNGFESGRYFPSSLFYSSYWTTFIPPTSEILEHETSKGIFDTLKSIPDLIAEKFKGLFIPSEGYFDNYIKEYQNYFSERFGLLYEVPDSIAGVFRQFVEFKPAEEGYYINFPEVVMPVLENGSFRDVTLIEETRVEFDFLDNGPISTLYSMYRAALWLLFVFLLINLIIRKSDKVFGGG